MTNEPNSPKKGQIIALWNPKEKQWVKPIKLPFAAHVPIEPVWVSSHSHDDCPSCRLLGSSTLRVSVWKDNK